MPGDVPSLFGGEGTEGILSYKTIKELQLTLGKACQKSVKKVESIAAQQRVAASGLEVAAVADGSE